ncbi:MAG: hypothetical protein QM484_02395 [Woeseiaceae bacterium]
MKHLPLLFVLSIFSANALSESDPTTKVNLKYISGEEVISILRSLIDQSVSLVEENNVLHINASAEKTKNILPILKEIDTPASALTIEFIASSKQINFKHNANTYESNKNSNTIQSLAITERQWVTLNTGMSIPIAERRRNPDGTESQTFRYKKINKSYVFKVHEFSGWSVIQAGLSISSLSKQVAGAIENTELDTTIIGKTGEWLEVASRKPINQNNSGATYTTENRDSSHLYLYVRILKAQAKTIMLGTEEPIKTTIEPTQ